MNPIFKKRFTVFHLFVKSLFEQAEMLVTKVTRFCHNFVNKNISFFDKLLLFMCTCCYCKYVLLFKTSIFNISSSIYYICSFILFHFFLAHTEKTSKTVRSNEDFFVTILVSSPVKKVSMVMTLTIVKWRTVTCILQNHLWQTKTRAPPFYGSAI